MSLVYWFLAIVIGSLTSNADSSIRSYINETAGVAGEAISSGIGPVVPHVMLPSSPALLISIPIIMAIFGMITGALIALFYNILSSIIGGIEIRLEEKR
jgi:hypothetical protein